MLCAFRLPDCPTTGEPRWRPAVATQENREGGYNLVVTLDGPNDADLSENRDYSRGVNGYQLHRTNVQRGENVGCYQPYGSDDDGDDTNGDGYGDQADVAETLESDDDTVPSDDGVDADSDGYGDGDQTEKANTDDDTDGGDTKAAAPPPVAVDADTDADSDDTDTDTDTDTDGNDEANTTEASIEKAAVLPVQVPPDSDDGDGSNTDSADSAPPATE